MTDVATRTPDELRALSRLTFDELGSATGGIGGMHRAIADRVFRAVGPSARTVEVAHHAISGGVYAALRGAAGLAGRAADVALESRSAPPDRALSTTPRGAAALAAINGLIGDELERQGSELHQPMADLQFLCELRADKGEAWFDPDSIRLVRHAPPKTSKP